jgi:hypothetical protein
MTWKGEKMTNVIFDTPGDLIEILPTDKTEPSLPEIQIIDTLFKQQHSTIQKLLIGTKDVIIVGLLFILFSFPQLDQYIMKLFPSTTTSPYILIFVRCLCFMFTYFIVKNIHFARTTAKN